MSVWCVIPAAGKGTRSGLSENKIFFRYNGRSVLSRCLDALEGSGAYDGFVLVLNDADRRKYEKLTAEEGKCPLVKQIVSGGPTRRDSVYNGLRAVPEDAEIVSIHDAARPFVTRSIIEATIRDAREYGSGVISTRVVDTIKQVSPLDGTVTTPDRATLRAVQTPQTFDRRKLLTAYEKASAEEINVTDDAMLFEHTYGSVHLTEAEGAEKNRKLTLPEDFTEAGSIPAFRIGTGYDAHRLKEGRKLILCGVDVPHTRGLDGHSDADVAVHALMDAMLGALALGDIGHLFPDSDDRYLGICSLKLLENVRDVLRERGWQIGNADITIVAQKPKLAPFIGQMRNNIAEVLETGAENISVKATTTEHMGFEGEETGISAQASVLLVRRMK